MKKESYTHFYRTINSIRKNSMQKLVISVVVLTLAILAISTFIGCGRSGSIVFGQVSGGSSVPVNSNGSSLLIDLALVGRWVAVEQKGDTIEYQKKILSGQRDHLPIEARNHPNFLALEKMYDITVSGNFLTKWNRVDLLTDGTGVHSSIVDVLGLGYKGADSFAIQWRVEGGRIYFRGNEKAEVYDYIVSGSTLTLTDDFITIICKKQ